MRDTSIWSKKLRKALQESSELKEYVEFLFPDDISIQKKESRRLARLITNVELGLTLLNDIAPSEPAIAVKALLSGYRFPVPCLQNENNWRKVKIARFYLIRLKGELWERLLDEYIQLSEELRIFELANVNEIPELGYTSIFPNRLNGLYRPTLNETPPHTIRKVKLASTGLWYAKISVEGNSHQEVPIYIPQEVADLDLSNTVTFTKTRQAANPAYSVSRDTLLEEAREMDRKLEETGHNAENYYQRLSGVNFKLFDPATNDYQGGKEISIDKLVHIVGLLNVGKSTLLQILIYHLAKQGLRCALVVDNVASQVRLASLFRFGLDIPAAPILGKDRAEHLKKVYEPILLTQGEDIYKGGTHPAWRWFSPICPLLALNQSETIWEFGDEPCHQLYQKDFVATEIDNDIEIEEEENDTLVTCPFYYRCPRHQIEKDIATANVWLLTPGSLIHSLVPRQVFGKNMRFTEAVYRECNFLFVDEADRVQVQLDEDFAPDEVLLSNSENSFLNKLGLNLNPIYSSNRTIMTADLFESWNNAQHDAQKTINRICPILYQQEKLVNWLGDNPFTARSLFARLIRELVNPEDTEEITKPKYKLTRSQKSRERKQKILKGLFSLQTVPRRKQPLIYHHLSLRRWISEPLERLPYKGATAFVGDNRRWLDGFRQPYSFIPLRMKEKGKQARWHSAIKRLMMLNDSQLPEPEEIARTPQYNWSNWDEQPEGIQIAMQYDSRHTFKHPCLPGVSPRDLASLDVAIIEKINNKNNSLPLKRVGEAEEILNNYVSYWGKKVPNDDSDSSTPMHRPSIAAPAVFAKRENPLNTILIVWETKQCRDELIKEICTRLYLTLAEETTTNITFGGGEVKETIYEYENNFICLKIMHIADLNQNFAIGLKEPASEKQRKREQFMAERIGRIKAYLPSTKEPCGAIVEIKLKPLIPETDPKNAWRIGAAQANYLNQHINSISVRNKKTREEFIVRGGLNRVKSAVSDLFRQFGILPKYLIDPEKDGINLHTWLTCFYVLRRTRQTSENNSASTVVLVLRVNPINGEVKMTTPAWFYDDTKGWLSYPLAEQLLLNEKWHPDSYIDETTQEDNEEETLNERETDKQRLINGFVADCLQDCLNTPIEGEQSPHVIFMAEAQNARKLLKWLQNPDVPKECKILPGQINRQLSKQEKQRLSIVRFRETTQNEVPVAIWKGRKPAGRPSGIFKWKDVCDDSNQNVYLSIRKPLNSEKGISILKVSQSRLDNGKQQAGNTKPIEIVIVYSSAIEQDTLAKFVHNLRDRNPYYSDFNTLPFPFLLAVKTKEYAIGIGDRVELEQSETETEEE
jgi:hypothetical protein